MLSLNGRFELGMFLHGFYEINIDNWGRRLTFRPLRTTAQCVQYLANIIQTLTPTPIALLLAYTVDCDVSMHFISTG